MPDEPQNAREWGLKNERSARNSYIWIQKHLHYKAELKRRGFVYFK